MPSAGQWHERGTSLRTEFCATDTPVCVLASDTMHRSNANTRVQVSGWAGASSLHAGEGGTSVRYKGMVDCFVRTWQEEGYRAFFKVPPARPAVSASSSHSATSRGQEFAGSMVHHGDGGHGGVSLLCG
jgi:hypothetical protein